MESNFELARLDVECNWLEKIMIIPAVNTSVRPIQKEQQDTAISDSHVLPVSLFARSLDLSPLLLVQ